jgi:hypothetical protein
MRAAEAVREPGRQLDPLEDSLGDISGHAEFLLLISVFCVAKPSPRAHNRRPDQNRQKQFKAQLV